MSYFLITTADERTWRNDRPVLFLGEWCKPFEKKSSYGSLQSVTAAPFVKNQNQKLEDLNYLLPLIDKMIEETACALNEFHLTNFSKRYWNIVAGYWIHRYVRVMYNRYYTIKLALDQYAVDSTAVFDSGQCPLARKTSLDFIWALNDNTWNNLVYRDVLQFLAKDKLKYELIKVELKSKIIHTSVKSSWKNKLINLLSRLLPVFSRSNDGFILNSYLPLIKEMCLQLSLCQFPQVWKSPAIELSDVNPELRKKFKLKTEGYDGFELFLREQIGKVIPTCYLEGYKKIISQVESLPWPTHPKFIFTSNNFDTDEIFKMWTASKTEIGVPYFTGQHGNNYGTHFYAGAPTWPERSTSDKFFTWGWSDEKTNTVPAFNFKINHSTKCNPRGKALLIEKPAPMPVVPWDVSVEFQNYQEEQFKFVSCLSEKIQKETVIRLHSAYKNLHGAEEERWSAFSKYAELEFGNQNIWDLISKSRIVIHSYDSTGILETLALNIPTLCFWQGGFEHLLASAIPYYNLLKEAGIIYFSPEEAAEMLEKNWDEIETWWTSEKVQRARIAFCNQYTKLEKHPVLKMKKLLLAQLKH